MPTPSEHRHVTDRRRQSRGGRRTGDHDDLAPLVLLVGNDPAVVSLAEAVLARLRFAVTTTANADEALKLVPGLHPDIVVASPGDAQRIRLEAPEHLSVVVVTDQMRTDPEAILPAMREALRANLSG